MALPLLRNYVGGAFVPATATDTLGVENPATGEMLCNVPLSSPAEDRKSVV